VTLNQYIPNFDDLPTGKLVDKIHQRRRRPDCRFWGNTGNGDYYRIEGAPWLGVDVDQYYTYPEVQKTLLTSTAIY
jgi:hypothetical protein